MAFSILHLSDLHIQDKSGNTRTVLKKMLSDIANQNIIEDVVIVVVSGDIVDRAQYSEATYLIVIEFFKALRNIFSEQKVFIEFVPGNHDKQQSVIDSIIVTNFKTSNDIVELSEQEWDYISLSYRDYINLRNDIIKIFDNKNIPSTTYYMDEVLVSDGKIIFLNLDTSWSSNGGKKDYRTLRIAKNQLDMLKDSYTKVILASDSTPIFTVAIAHHPLNWLLDIDEAYLNKWFLDKEFFGIDAFLCGHTHDRQISNICNNINSYITLVTGVGWGRQTVDDSYDSRRYSIYNIDLNSNICEITIRKTKSDLSFDYDYDALVNEIDKENKRILLPLSPHKMYPFLQIPTYNKNAPKKITYRYKFINNSMSKSILDFSLISFEIGTYMQQYLKTFINMFFIQYNLENHPKVEIYREYFYSGGNNNITIDNLFSDIIDKDLLFKNFISYLQQFCKYISLLLYNKFPNCDGVRCHFRHYYTTSNNCPPLYIAFCQDDNSNSSYADASDIRDIEYDKSLIQCSFITGTPLVYSHNVKYNILDIKEWQNFITIVPDEHFNHFEIHNGVGHQPDVFPLISCAISVRSDNEIDILDILNGMHIKSIISNIINDFISMFHIEIKDIVKYLIDQINENN